MGTRARRAAGAVALAAGMMIGGVGLGHALAATGSASPNASSSTSSKGTESASSGHTCPRDTTGSSSNSA
jgi:hypothetical protein